MKSSSNETPVETINIGIYGHTSAGKTQFLYHLLDGWDTSNRIRGRSSNCDKFLSQARSQIKAFGKPNPTTESLDDIWVQVAIEEVDTPTKLIFQDLRGEELSKELDKTTFDRKDKIPEQVKKCDAFLFFFDPASSESRERLLGHHKDERERAEKFAEYVLSTRQNAYLPIMFLQTHLDKWENEQEVCDKAKEWQSQIKAKVRKLYQDHLKGHFPDSLCDGNKTHDAISSVRDREVERPIGMVVELVREARVFSERTRTKARGPLVAGIGVAVLAIILVACLVLWGTGEVPKEKKPLAPFPSTEKEVLARLDQLESVVSEHAPAGQLPSRKEAEKINSHLKWLTLVSEGINDKSSIYADMAENTRKRIDGNLNKLAGLIRSKMDAINGPVSSDQLDVLAGYLEEIQVTSAESAVGRLQASFWDLARKYAIQQTASVIKRRREVASTPKDTINELLKSIGERAKELTNFKVGPSSKRDGIIGELKTAETFCEDRKNKGNYPVLFQVTAANFTPGSGKSLDQCYLRVLSPGQPPFLIELEAHGAGTTLQELTPSKASYQFDIGLGKPVKGELLVFDSEKKPAWTSLHEFELLNGLNGISLADLGLNVVLDNHKDVEQSLSWQGYKFKVKFTDLPAVPPLIWETVRLSLEEKK